MKKYQFTFTFFDDEQSAKAFCENENRTGTAWKRLKYKAHYTPWTSKEKTENAFVAFYYI